MKACTKCGIEKPPEDFHWKIKAQNLRQTFCRSCVSLDRERRRAYDKVYYWKNRKKRNKLTRSWYKSHKREYVSRAMKKNFEKYHNDPIFRLVKTQRNRVNSALRKNNNSKTEETIKLLGCTPDFFKKHLEKQFYDNPRTGDEMTWNNHSFYGWHVDHIKPCASFDLSDPRTATTMFSLH